MKFLIGALLICNLYFDGFFGTIFGVAAIGLILSRFGIDWIFCLILAIELLLQNIAFKSHMLPPSMNEIFGMGGLVVFGSTLICTIAIRYYLHKKLC